MSPIEKQRFIQQKAVENRHDSAGAKVYWSHHAVAEMVKDALTRISVETALEKCQLIEDYPPRHRPLPDCLVLGTLAEGDPIHAVVAIDEANDRIFMITVYRPTRDRWENDWQTRR
jgi:hypothetical protein